MHRRDDELPHRARALAGAQASRALVPGVDVSGAVKRATDLANKFEQQLASQRVGTDEERSATDLRNRAAAHLWEAMSEIRAAGTYAFRNDAATQALFRSTYRRRHRGGDAKAAGDGATPPAAPTA